MLNRSTEKITVGGAEHLHSLGASVECDGDTNLASISFPSSSKADESVRIAELIREYLARGNTIERKTRGLN